MKRVGPRTAALEKLAMRSERLRFAFKMDTPPGYTAVDVDVRPSDPEPEACVSALRQEPLNGYSLPLRPLGLAKGLQQINAQLPKGRIKWDSLVVKPTKAPLDGKALKEAVVKALKESFPGSANDDSPRGDERIHALLRGGAAGRAAWNALGSEETEAVSSFRNMSLNDGNFDRYQLHFLDFQGSDFSRSSIRNADLGDTGLNRCRLVEVNLSNSFCFHTKFHSANLARASLRGAVLREAKLRDANLEGADLSRADLRGADFSGANLRNAKLAGVKVGPYSIVKTGTRYDARTKFPVGFKPGPGWAKGPG